MKRIKIEDTLYNVPESWDDVTLGQYEKWFDYVADSKMKEVELVSLISTIPFDLLSTLPLSFYTEVLNMVSFAFAGNDFNRQILTVCLIITGIETTYATIR